MSFEMPDTLEGRKGELINQINLYTTEYDEFKSKGKAAAGSRAKKALTVVKKLITTVRRDIQSEIDAVKKAKKEAKKGAESI